MGVERSGSCHDYIAGIVLYLGNLFPNGKENDAEDPKRKFAPSPENYFSVSGIGSGDVRYAGERKCDFCLL